MRFFVTGYRGYIGSHLIDVIKAEGHTVMDATSVSSTAASGSRW